MAQMKQNNIEDADIPKLGAQQLENIFNVFRDNEIHGNYAYNILKTVQFPSDLDKTVYDEYVVQPKDHWPGVAYKFYSDIKLWWIIASANHINNPLNFPDAGTILKIIKPNIVRTILGKLRN